MLIPKLRNALKAKVDKTYKEGAQRYFKEEIKLYGVRVPEVRKISAEFYKQVKDKSKLEIYEICEVLMQSGFAEEKTIAFNWVDRQKKSFTADDFEILEGWIDKYVKSWADCDDICSHAFGFLIYTFDKLTKKLFAWTKSENRWLRRASAVALIYSVRKGKNHAQALKTAEALLMDEDDLVQKGYGWLLKVLSDYDTRTVFDFVYARKDKMPRTALRYAIEKMPVELRKKAMHRD